MNLSELSFDNAKDILEDLKNTNPAFFDLKEVGTDWFLNRRKYLEEKIRDLFIKKGGAPKSKVPHYMSLGESDYLKEWFINPSFVKIPIEEFNVDTLSFCYGDVFPTFSDSFDDGKEYRKQVYTFDEIKEIIKKYGYPQEWNKNGENGPERYIEVHVWCNEVISDFK
jgi:hypothetical protein